MRLIPLVLVLLAGVAAVWWMQRSRAHLRSRIAEEAEARRKLEELQSQLLKRTVELDELRLRPHPHEFELYYDC